MVIFEKWLIKTLKKNCGLLKIRKNGLSYSTPYDSLRDGFFDESSGIIQLENLVTGEFDDISIKDVYNIEIFSIDNYDESKRVLVEFIKNSIFPILSYEFKWLSRSNVFDMIFLDGMNINYMIIMDFMQFTSPGDFSLVNFERFRNIPLIDVNPEEIYKNYEAIVNKKRSIFLSDIRSVVESPEDVTSMMNDLNENVDEFLSQLRTIPINRLQDWWPTLLNPSPFFFQTNKTLIEG